MSKSGGPALRAVALTRHFEEGEKRIDVLRNLDLTVEPGQSVAVVGESGVGKSTLLHLLGALDRPDGGTVSIGGQELFELSAAELAKVRNRSVGFVFQFHHLLGDFDAVENVMMPLLIQGRSRSHARARSVELLERVGLGERLQHRPGQLSGGEQQRVAVARSVAARPPLVLADEPTGNLDPATAHDVQELLLEIQREAGCAMVVATHSRALADALDLKLRLAGGVLSREPQA